MTATNNIPLSSELNQTHHNKRLVASRKGFNLVHKADVANVANSLLLSSPNKDFTAGIIALASALGCELK